VSSRRAAVVHYLGSDGGDPAVVAGDHLQIPHPGNLASMSRLDRITSNPEVCHGQPTVRGLRYSVETLLELLSGGMTIEEVLADYPDLERDDLLAALEFGALAAGHRRVVPLGSG